MIRTMALLAVSVMITGCGGGAGPTFPSPHTVSIDGQITDALTGEGIRGVTVRVGDQSAVTDRQGRYHLANVEPGTQAVQVELPGGYRLAGTVSNVEIDEGRINLEDIYLVPDVEQPPAPPAPPTPGVAGT